MITTKMTTVPHDIIAITQAAYYILAFLLLAAGFASLGKGFANWLLGKLYDLMLGI